MSNTQSHFHKVRLMAKRLRYLIVLSMFGYGCSAKSTLSADSAQTLDTSPRIIEQSMAVLRYDPDLGGYQETGSVIHMRTTWQFTDWGFVDPTGTGSIVVSGNCQIVLTNASTEPVTVAIDSLVMENREGIRAGVTELGGQHLLVWPDSSAIFEDSFRLSFSKLEDANAAVQGRLFTWNVPQVSLSVADLLIGTWSRIDGEKNEIIGFKADGRLELYDYSAPGGGQVDRNAAYPQTLVITYYGTYALAGNLLRLSFTGVQVNNPNGTLPALPLTDKVVAIQVTRTTLILEERDGDQVYTRI